MMIPNRDKEREYMFKKAKAEAETKNPKKVKINLYYEICENRVKMDLRNLCFKNKLQIAIALLRNKIIQIHGNTNEKS